ncbi:hypothetical protein PDE_01936 [Penicillium oxalicum 114-2]|uniref:Uncharacterized protein n=1 Tax=Penicillium oxalicum (strain 114-2 / CGMCC 5302) TaxID=933388 RepID=S7Z8S3_PENO1|nr:hypothetical protein PDE_01936 [Penicillium oxalicum 114-2]
MRVCISDKHGSDISFARTASRRRVDRSTRANCNHLPNSLSSWVLYTFTCPISLDSSRPTPIQRIKRALTPPILLSSRGQKNLPAFGSSQTSLHKSLNGPPISPYRNTFRSVHPLL